MGTPDPPDSQARVREYFRAKQRQLATLADLRACDHPGLAGGHREEAAIFLRGGRDASALTSLASEIERIDDQWPDLLLLVEPGLLVVKGYSGGAGRLMFFELGEDALLAFTNGLLTLASERSAEMEEPLYLYQYAHEVAEIAPVAELGFHLTRPAPSVYPLWRS